MATATVDEILQAYAEKRLLGRLGVYVDVWKAVRGIAGYERLIERVFGRSMDAKIFDAFKEYATNIENWSFPVGRDL